MVKAKTLNHVKDPSEVGWRAQEWIKNNPDAWDYITKLALKEVAHERHFSIRYLMEQARSKDFARADSEPFKINNSLSPGFARILIKEHPEVKPFIEVRRAACDGMV